VSINHGHMLLRSTSETFEYKLHVRSLVKDLSLQSTFCLSNIVIW